MALDTRDFVVRQPDFAGQISQLGDTLTRNELRRQQLDLAAQSRRQAAATGLNNYLDAKDFMTGTAYDPMLVQQLQTARSQGMALAASGADLPTIMMALGPVMNRINQYSSTAKTISQNIDASIKGYTANDKGFNPAVLKQEALKRAFYDIDKNGQQVFNPDKADPTTDYVTQAIQEGAPGISSNAMLEQFAKESPKVTENRKLKMYDKVGTLNERDMKTTLPSWATLEFDKKGGYTGMVPVHDVATENTEPLLHTFKDANGKNVTAPVRMVPDKTFDDLVKQYPSLYSTIIDEVKQHISEYENKTGNKISLDSPQAKNVAKALLYNDLKGHITGMVEPTVIDNKPSAQSINLQIQSSPQFQANTYANTKAREDATLDAKQAHGVGTGKSTKTNVVQTLYGIANGDPNFSTGETVKIGGKELVDLTPNLPGGLLKNGKGDKFKYGRLLQDKTTGDLIVEKTRKNEYGIEKTDNEIVPKADIEKFARKLATKYGVDIAKFGDYWGGKAAASKAAPAEDKDPLKIF